MMVNILLLLLPMLNSIAPTFLTLPNHRFYHLRHLLIFIFALFSALNFVILGIYIDDLFFERNFITCFIIVIDDFLLNLYATLRIFLNNLFSDLVSLIFIFHQIRCVIVSLICHTLLFLRHFNRR